MLDQLGARGAFKQALPVGHVRISSLMVLTDSVREFWSDRPRLVLWEKGRAEEGDVVLEPSEEATVPAGVP